MVHVRAQVMMRDDSTGGWLPLGGGGMSNANVSVRKTRKLQGLSTTWGNFWVFCTDTFGMSLPPRGNQSQRNQPTS